MNETSKEDLSYFKQELLINGSTISIVPTPFDGKLSIDEYKSQLYNALDKIGVKNNYIEIQQNEESVKISWEINEQQFSFSCNIYNSYRENLGACVQAIREDIRHILRGIKDIDLVLKQYATNHITSPKKKKVDLFSFKEEKIEQKEEKIKQIEILGEMHAKQIIQEIKEKYPQFSNYTFLPDEDRVNLEKAFTYLGKRISW